MVALIVIGSILGYCILAGTILGLCDTYPSLCKRLNMPHVVLAYMWPLYGPIVVAALVTLRVSDGVKQLGSRAKERKQIAAAKVIKE